jgi:Tol biopolymer transport system component
LRRITSNPGGDDIPGDYSPDGKRLVFVRLDPDGEVGLFVTRLTGSGLRQITPPGMILDEITNTGRADQPDWGPHPLIP